MRLSLKSRFPSFAILAAIAIVFAALPMARAVDIFSVSGTGLVAGSSSLGYDNAAFQFQIKTDIIQATGFKAPMWVSSGSSSVTFSIYNDSGSDLPGTTLMADGTISISNTTEAEVTFPFNSYFNLQPSTKYWYVFYKPNNGVVVYAKAGFLSQATTTQTYATLTGNSASAGTTAPPLSGWNTNSIPPNFIFAATLVGTVNPVPEPSTYALGTIATGVIAALARRRKARKA